MLQINYEALDNEDDIFEELKLAEQAYYRGEMTLEEYEELAEKLHEILVNL